MQEIPMTIMQKIFVPSAVALALAVGCNKMNHKHDDAMKMDASAKDKKVAVAHMTPAQSTATQPSQGKAMGDITFTQKGEKVHVTGTITGLPPGKHGIHIHEKGDVSAPDLMSTGGDFNPDKHVPGGPTTSPVHAGDLGNLTADTSGKATLDLTV